MGFEKRALAVAEECGIEDAHFYQGTMFFSADNVTIGMVDDLVESLKRTFFSRVEVSNAGDEIAVDFVV